MGKHGVTRYWTPEKDEAIRAAWTTDESVEAMAERICPELTDVCLLGRAKHLGMQSRYVGNFPTDPNHEGSSYKNAGRRPWYAKRHDPFPWYSQRLQTKRETARANERHRQLATCDQETYDALLAEGCSPEEISDFFRRAK